KESVVVPYEDRAGEKQLAAYVVAQELGSAEPRGEELRAYLQERLPEYMIPSAVIVLEQMPLTPNGKLDRRALPAPERADRSCQYEAPLGESEEALARIWRELLQVERVGRADDFFDLGGNSLMAMRLAARIQSFFSVGVPVKVVFACHTVQQLAACIDEARRA